MVLLRNSSLPSICLALVMGLALAWPDLAHRRLHEEREHHHEHLEHRDSSLVLGHLVGSESHHSDHPHLDVIATVPAKAVLHLALLVVEHPALMDSTRGVVRVSEDLNDSNRPRSPPSGPPPAIRAPPPPDPLAYPRTPGPVILIR